MASQVERVFYGSNQVPGQQLSREDIKQLRFRIKRDGGTIDNVVFDPLVGQDLYMACLKFFKNYSHGSNPTEVGHYEVGNAGANGNDFNVEINNQEIFLFREDDLVLTDAEFTRLNADLVGWTPVALRSMSSDNVQHQWLYLSRSPDNGIRFICIEDTKARIAIIAPDSPHNIAISDAFDTSLFELKSNKVSYIDPTIDQSGNYLGGSAVNDFVEKRTFAISVPYGVTNNNTFTKILEYNELYSSSTSRGAIFARLKIQFVDTYLDHRLREVDAYIGYDLYNKKPLVTFGSCYKAVYESDYDLKNLHIVTYDSNTRCHIEVYLEHRKLTSMRQWISVEVCENFQVVETSYGTRTSHSNWKIPLTSNHWDMVNGASIQPTVAALPITGVLKTDSYIIQSGNQVPFTYMPFGTSGHEMAIAKLASDSSYTKLVFKLYCKREGWVAIGKVERDSGVFKLSFSAISDHADFTAGVALPYIYLSLLDGVYYVNLNIDSYRTVLESIAIEVENEKKDWEFFGSIPPDSVGTTVSGTDTYMKADLTAEVIDQGTNVPAPTSSTKVLTKQVDASGREFWKTEEMSDIIAGHLANVVPMDKLPTASSVTSGDTTHVPTVDAVYNFAVKQDVAGYGIYSSLISEGDWRCSIPNITNKTVSISIPANSTKWIKIPGGGVAGELLKIGFKYGSSNCFMTLTVELSERAFGFKTIKVLNKFGNPALDGGIRRIGLSSDQDGGNGPWLYIKVSNTDSVANNVKIASTRTSDITYEVLDNKDKVTATELEISRSGTVLEQTHRVTYNGMNSTYANGAVGSPTCPVYVKSDGLLEACNLRLVNATADIQLDTLGSGEDAWVRVRNAGSSSITVIAGTLNRTLSPTQFCDVFGYNGSYVQIS